MFFVYISRQCKKLNVLSEASLPIAKLPCPSLTLLIVFYSGRYDFLVRAVHYWFATVTGMRFQTFDTF